MRVLFDVSHPAHVHLFKHAITQLEDAGHETTVTSREKDITTELLDAYGIDHTPISAKGESKLSLATEWVAREFRMLAAVLSFDPDVIVSRLNPPAAHASAVARCPNIVFDDSEVVQFAGRITHPFSDVVCTPSNFDRELGDKQERYDGFHELAYLHPNQFEPDDEILEGYGITPDETYSVLRFVSWGAHHDVAQQGLSPEMKTELVSTLSDHGDVYITSESSLPPEFEPYRIPVEPEEIHHLLYFADLYVGDSQTMATEAALLGTPSVRSNSFAGDGDMSNFVELEEEYELLHSVSDADRTLDLVRTLITDPEKTEVWSERRSALIDDKIDVTDYLLDQIYALGEKE